MSNRVDYCKLKALGQLKLFDKSTGKELAKSNLVVKDSSHIAILGLGGDIYNTEIKVASWGDNFSETPSKTGYNWTQLEALSGSHQIDDNHTIKVISTGGHSYPSHKAIRFSFEFNKSSAPELIGKNLMEWGLFFNGILFSRVSLETDYVFEDWMNTVGYWTIIFTTCSGGYSNFILNQYELNSLWGFNYIEDNKIIDYVGTNDLTCDLSIPVLTSSLIGFDSVTDEDIKNNNSLPTYYQSGSDYNVAYITSNNQQRVLLSEGKFTIWQWFKVKDISTMSSGDEWVMLSKWMSVPSNTDDQSFRIYLSYDGSDYKINFDINDGGLINTISSYSLNFDSSDTLSYALDWNLVVITFNYGTSELIMYLNDDEMSSETLSNFGINPSNNTALYIGSQQYDIADETVYDNTKIFEGFIDETVISYDIFSRSAISLLWNNGIGDFYTP